MEPDPPMLHGPGDDPRGLVLDLGVPPLSHHTLLLGNWPRLLGVRAAVVWAVVERRVAVAGIHELKVWKRPRTRPVNQMRGSIP